MQHIKIWNFAVGIFKFRPRTENIHVWNFSLCRVYKSDTNLSNLIWLQ
jgi:hypothetical protein